jgi:DNA mismatch repair protein MutS
LAYASFSGYVPLKSLTALGRRELKQVLSNPVQNIELLKSRQQLVKYFKDQTGSRKLFRQKIFEVHDLHRLVRRIKSPRELLQLKDSLEAGMAALNALDASHLEMQKFESTLKFCYPLYEQLAESLQSSEDDDWGWIKEGINPSLDELRNLKLNADRLLSELEANLRTETGVGSLKVKFHQVFGYVAEVTALHKEKIPANAKRIQSLANSDRFKTDALIQLEEKLLSLESRIREAERSELQRLFSLAANFESPLLEWATTIATLDCFQALAEVSQNLGWSTPRMNSRPGVLRLTEAVHPLAMNSFIPLNFELNATTQQILLLTGPNMAGKSTVLRIAALTALLHQIGSDIPARNAELSVFDRIGCRMGATDDITTGQSTFFVEMREVASMLHGATEKSLLVFDEIGRGTSTYDGMSLAWAITEEVHELKALSLIATHYLELADLERLLNRLRSYHLGVEEIRGRLIFTRELKPGPASRSYGIHVAKLADIPQGILTRAQLKLNEFEKRRTKPLPLFDLMKESARSVV